MIMLDLRDAAQAYQPLPLEPRTYCPRYLIIASESINQCGTLCKNSGMQLVHVHVSAPAVSFLLTVAGCDILKSNRFYWNNRDTLNCFLIFGRTLCWSDCPAKRALSGGKGAQNAFYESASNISPDACV